MLCTPKPNGFADHYPYEKWLFHWEYTQHFQTNPYTRKLSRSKYSTLILGFTTCCRETDLFIQRSGIVPCNPVGLYVSCHARSKITLAAAMVCPRNLMPHKWPRSQPPYQETSTRLQNSSLARVLGEVITLVPKLMKGTTR